MGLPLARFQLQTSGFGCAKVPCTEMAVAIHALMVNSGFWRGLLDVLSDLGG